MSPQLISDEEFMCEALKEAEKAARRKEVPIGAIAVSKGQVIARAHNIRESTEDPLGHAELLLLRKIARKLRSWRLESVTVYVTLEPCLMCFGALLQARVARLVFGAMDPKAGVCGSLYDLSSDHRFNHRIEVTSGVMKTECSGILKKFFEKLRKKRG